METWGDTVWQCCLKIGRNVFNRNDFNGLDQESDDDDDDDDGDGDDDEDDEDDDDDDDDDVRPCLFNRNDFNNLDKLSNMTLWSKESETAV